MTSNARPRRRHHRRRRPHAAPAGLRPGAGAAHERVLELRHLAVDHLHPGRRHHVVPRRLLQRRRRGDRPRLAAGVPVLAGASRRRWGRSPRLSRRPAGSITGRRSSAAAAGAGPPPGSTSPAWSPCWPRSTSARTSSSSARSSRSTPSNVWLQVAVVALITASQALLNHLGIRVTRWLTDFSGYWILLVAAVLTVACCSPRAELRLRPAGHVHQLQRPAGGRAGLAADRVARLAVRPGLPAAGLHDHRLRRLGPRLGGDGRRGAATCRAASSARCWSRASPAGSCCARSCWPCPTRTQAARQGTEAFFWTLYSALPAWLASAAVRRHRRRPVPVRPGDGDLGVADGVRLRPRRRAARLGAGCGTSRRASARRLARSGPSALAAVLFTVYTPVYSTITAVCVIFLYVSYVLPTALGPRRLRPHLDADGAVAPRPLVSAARGDERARLRRADRDRHAAAERPGADCRSARCWRRWPRSGSWPRGSASPARRSGHCR